MPGHHVRERAREHVPPPVPSEPVPLRGPAPAAAMLALQQTIGNHAVQQLMPSRTPELRLLRAIDIGIVDRMRPGAVLSKAQQAELGAMVKEYDDACPGDASRASLQNRQRLLDQIEHRIYAWFEDVRGALDPQNAGVRDHPTLQGMFELMNAVQRDHTAVIRELVAAGEQVWVAGDVSGGERAEIDALWANITSGTGAFQVLGQIATAAGVKDVTPAALERFKTEIYAGLARLMSRPKGRALLKALKEGHPSAGGTNIEFKLPPLYKLMGTPDFADVPYVGAQATESNPLPSKLSGETGALVPGGGSTSGVAVAPGIHDASMMDFDERGGLIPSPAFVGVGHELIHAAHYARGTYTGLSGAQMPEMPQGYGGDVEEFLTIASPQQHTAAGGKTVKTQGLEVPFSQLAALNAGLPTEAEIRAEHGIGLRHGHETTANPFLHEGADVHHNPGEFIADAIEWLEESWPVADETEEKRAHEQAKAPAPDAAPAAAAPRTSGPMETVRGWLAALLG